MDAVRLSRLTTALVVVGGGLAAGHLLLPYAAAAPATRRVAFWGLVLLLGAFRGWREGVVREAAPRGRRRRAAAYAAAAALLAWAANWLVHGGPRWP